MSKHKNEDDMTTSDEPLERVIPVSDGDGLAAEAETPTSEAGHGEAATQELEQLRARVAEFEDQRLRSLADLDNFKKRMARQFEDVIRGANDRLLTDLLEVVDNFERARSHTGNGAEGDGVRQGMELIYSQLTDLLKRYQVEPIPAVGQAFDPNLHEALLQVDSSEYGDGVVAQEIARGYRLGDRVLRYAKVAVSKGRSANDAADGGTNTQE